MKLFIYLLDWVVKSYVPFMDSTNIRLVPHTFLREEKDVYVDLNSFFGNRSFDVSEAFLKGYIKNITGDWTDAPHGIQGVLTPKVIGYLLDKLKDPVDDECIVACLGEDYAFHLYKRTLADMDIVARVIGRDREGLLERVLKEINSNAVHII